MHAPPTPVPAGTARGRASGPHVVAARADPDHEACARLLTEATGDLIVPALVLPELDYWCSRRLPGEPWLVFLDDVIAGAYQAEAPTPQDLERCRDLQGTYRDLDLGVVDASIIALVERLGESKVATLDRRHFGVVRPRHVDVLRIVP